MATPNFNYDITPRGPIIPKDAFTAGNPTGKEVKEGFEFADQIMRNRERAQQAEQNYKIAEQSFNEKTLSIQEARNLIKSVPNSSVTDADIDTFLMPYRTIGRVPRIDLDKYITNIAQKPEEITIIGTANYKKGDKVPATRTEESLDDPAQYTRTIARDGQYRISMEKKTGKYNYAWIGERDTYAQDERRDRQSEKSEEKFKERVIAQFNKIRTDKRMTELSKQLDAMRGVEQLVDASKDNTIATQAIGIRLPRALGEVGNLTEAEQTRYVSSPQVYQNLKDKIGRYFQGRSSEATREEILELSNILSSLAETKKKELTSEYVDNLANTYKREPAAIALMLGLDFETEYIPKEERVALERAKRGASSVSAPADKDKAATNKRVTKSGAEYVVEK